ncbi:hypothetical protein [Thermoflexibacter ruber]|uniref:Uncharacterized protein n=1 Tax=Thermoflexibacter ruber TaxID=1003 RepID=A0A1I2J6S8_9BACT|nr:hypothetical protein [Thermoflexibacter ruber]SFF49553.1 hypothetical protein SAMN04488541_104212 [Thermoflexibacter ruber]
MATYQVKSLNKGKEIIENLQTHLPKVHKSMRKFITLFVLALCKVKTVNIDKIASGFDSKASTAAVKKRMQRFFNTYFMDYQLIALQVVIWTKKH